MKPLSITIVVLIALGVSALAACGSNQLQTESYGYGSVYTQLGRD